VEGQIASLEEKKTGAEQALHRVQNEMREAQDLVNATKKHSAVLQDTLTVRTLFLFSIWSDYRVLINLFCI